MLHGGDDGSSLELRAARNGRRVIRGKFPYRKWAVLSDGGRGGGRPRKERFAPGAFAHSINSADQDIALLSGHDFAKPLASKFTNTLIFSDTADALVFDAEIVEEVAQISWAQDLFRLIASGLSIGLSPGFRLPPPRAVEKAEEITEEVVDPSRGMYGALLRTILQAVLFELSIVTRPAYDEAQVEMRNWQPTDAGVLVPNHARRRWRP
jgi:HK97 family phage prohead protease